MKNLINNKKKKLILIISNIPNKNSIFKLITKKILSKNFSCCINYKKINSLYIWNNKTKKKKEIQIIFKTINIFKNKIIKIIKKYHTYKIPEIFTININYINKSYYKWIKNNLIKPR